LQGSIKKLQEEISAFGAKKQELDETVSQQKEVRGRKGRERRETDERERERERAPHLVVCTLVCGSLVCVYFTLP
jgi:hypothetical protein